MSVLVKALTKIYGDQKAVDSLSFTAVPGEILGFLGPNGAGKSTTMKMLTGYLDPTSGDADLSGFSILKDPLAVRKITGYLPEHNPLYKGMYVREFLTFVAGLHKISKPQKRIEEVIEMTGLGKEQHKIVGALSKGYRQRVGLAQAIFHDPEVLILDEPTSGLDMNQLIDIRSLIKELGKEKTVIFSTHIMQEVQALCDRVVIINNGKLVADDPISKLQSRIEGETIIHLETMSAISNIDIFKKIKGVKSVQLVHPRQLQIHTMADKDLRPAIFNCAVDHQLTILEMRKEELSVEYIFQQLTRKKQEVSV